MAGGGSSLSVEEVVVGLAPMSPSSSFFGKRGEACESGAAIGDVVIPDAILWVMVIDAVGAYHLD